MIKVIKFNEGMKYTPSGHDATVESRVLVKPQTTDGVIDFHVTSFKPGDGMASEIHENSDHLFYVLNGCIEVKSKEEHIAFLNANDSVYIPAGDYHQILNSGSCDGVFLAVTFPTGKPTEKPTEMKEK